MILLTLLSLLAAAPDSGAVADSAAALARARALHPAVSAGDAGPLWDVFGPSMRKAMKDSASFAANLRRMQSQLGAIDSVVSEELVRSGENLIYHAQCRFAGVPMPLTLTIAFTPDGLVNGFRLTPAEARKPHPSPFLEYQTKTRLQLPFRGEWFVFWGGRTAEQNQHVFSRSQRFAHDLVIRRDGTTHRGDGKRCEDYWCYGEPVLAPAAGTVAWLEDGHPDQEPGRMDRDHPIGNGVLIDHGNGEFSLLAHLQPRSLRVEKGERVRSGQVLGACGNSGNTSEPHLHYHLQNDADPLQGEGLPAQFVDLVVDGQPVGRAEILRGQLVRRSK